MADFRRWAEKLSAVGQRLAPHFARAGPGRNVLEYVDGLLLDGDRKNTWQLSERIGEPNLDAVQHLLGSATWKADAVRGILPVYV